MKIRQVTAETAASKTKFSRNPDGLKNWNELHRAVRHSSSNPSDPRHSARLTIDGREVVISKQSAESLFRWLKKNFKTKHERELYDFLVHQRLLGVLDDEKYLNEINYASALADPTISKKEIIANSIEDGTIGSRKVFLYSSNDNKIYYFERDSHIDALVYIFKDRLLGMKNYSDNRGLIFNLLQFVINIKNKTVRLTASDKLTRDGLHWIIRQIKSKNGFNITDAQGNAIDPHELYAEWEQARTTGVHGPTEIVISKSSNSNSIKENEERLMPMDIWGATLLHTSSNAVDVGELFETEIKDVVAEGDYSDEEIERYGPELIQRQRNLDLLASVFGYQNIHRVARALRAGNLKRRLRHNEGTPEERAQYSRAVRILDSMTDESGNIMPHTDTTVYRQK